jgi:DNA replication licensing factor MCM5
MSGWDEGNQRMEGMPIRAQEPGSNEPEILKARFANFLKNFTENAQNFFLYREQLVSQNEGQLEGNAFIRVQLDHLIMFDRDLSERLIATPAKIIDDFEKAASQLYFELTQNRREDDSLYQFQVQFYSKAGANAVRNNIRTLGSGDVTKLVVLDGIIIRAAPPKAKARSIIVRCRKCQETMQRIYVRPGVGGFTYPRYCRNASCDKPQDSLYIVPELGEYVDQQQLRLQELPESVPPSEMPRHVSMTVDRALVNSIAAGVRVRIVGIYSIFTAQSRGPSEKLGNGAIAVKQTYLRVIGLQALPSPASGRSVSAEFSPEEEAQFRELSMAPDIYDRISRSIAPSIYGLEDQKKAVACLLFGGARKKLPDGMTLRGDINVLLLGDPATAKSQLLKFAERVAPICIYTSGKGSSAAGLTGSCQTAPVTNLSVNLVHLCTLQRLLYGMPGQESGSWKQVPWFLQTAVSFASMSLTR